MKEKQWIFFRVMVYLGLAGAGMVLFMLLYFAVEKYGRLHIINPVSVLVVTASLLQITFNVLNARLIHHHLFNKLLPGKAFGTFHTVLLVINSCIAVALLCIFLYGCAETFETNPYHKSPNTEDVIALVLIGTYTFITIGTITGSLVLRRYIKYATSAEEDEWLNQIGA